MDYKKKIGEMLAFIMKRDQLNQEQIASVLDVSQNRISKYLNAKELPSFEIIIKIAKSAGVKLDELTEDHSFSQPFTQKIENSRNVIAPIQSSGDIYVNTTVNRQYKYMYQEGDLTEEQAANLHRLVDEIIDLEQTIKKKPRSYGAVWGALKKHFKVTYYRKIRTEDYPRAEAYFKQWIGRLKRQKSYPKKDEDEFRKKRYTAIYAATKGQLGWSREQLHDYVFAEYGVTSLTELSVESLQTLYDRIFSKKARATKAGKLDGPVRK